MGNTDSIPVVSQAKSTFQLITGDVAGANRTQDNFVHECPGFSQLTSGVYLLTGDTEKADETHKRCVNSVSNLADGIPLVGHIKGTIHEICGDEEGASKAYRAATRTTGVMAGGAAGFLVGGPAGAAIGGMAAGSTMDGVETLASTADNGQMKPVGVFAASAAYLDKPSAGTLFDLFAVPAGDALTGYQAGQLVKKAVGSSGPKNAAKAAELRAQADATLSAAEANSGSSGSGAYLKQCNKAQSLYQQAVKLETGNAPTVFNPKVRVGGGGGMPVVPVSIRPEETRSKTRVVERKIETRGSLWTRSFRIKSKPKIVEHLEFYQLLLQVIQVYKTFDIGHSLRVLEEKVEKLLKGQGAPVSFERVRFAKVMLKEDEMQDFRTLQVVSVLYGKATADEFEEESKLKGMQLLLRHQNTGMGALHILLSHPLDMRQLIPGLDVSLFPPEHRKLLKSKKMSLGEWEKKELMEKANAYFAKNPKDKVAMLENELRLVAMLKLHLNPTNFRYYQFYEFGGKAKFRVVFNVPTISGEFRELSVCLSCTQSIQGKAIIYKSPGADGVECDSYEIITSFLT